jgi:methyltransferase (TIGR00027 family)
MRDSPSLTAEAVCAMRALDQRRPAHERIIDDPYAELFLGPVLKGALATFRASGELGLFAERFFPGIMSYVQCRHRFIDDALKRAISSGAVSQVILLGAGYDTRAYRFASQLSGIPVFEVDHPSTSKRKAQIVADHAADLPKSDVIVVEIDFQTERLEDKLKQAGFVFGAQTFFVWEGVSMYLTRSAIKATLGTIRTIAAFGSQLAMDFWFMLDSPALEATAHRVSPSLLHFLGEPMTFGIHPEDAGDFFRREGYRVIDLADAQELEARYVRDDRRVYPANYVLHAQTVEP